MIAPPTTVSRQLPANAGPYDMSAALMRSAGNSFSSAAGINPGAAGSQYNSLFNRVVDGGRTVGPPSEAGYQNSVISGLNKFMNPYYDQVISSALGRVTDSRDMRQQALQSQARTGASFGGDRQAIMEAQLNQDYMRESGDLANQMYSQAYESGLGASFKSLNDLENIRATQQQERLARGGLLNNILNSGEVAQNNRFGTQMAGAQGAAQMGGMYFDVGERIADRNLQAGGMQQQLLQQILSGGADQFQQYLNTPYQSLDLINAILSQDARAREGTQSGSETKPGPGLFDYLSLGTGVLGSAFRGGFFN